MRNHTKLNLFISLNPKAYMDVKIRYCFKLSIRLGYFASGLGLLVVYLQTWVKTVNCEAVIVSVYYALAYRVQLLSYQGFDICYQTMHNLPY